MIINRVNLNNNFGAKIVGKLKTEIDSKKSIAKISSSTKHFSLNPENSYSTSNPQGKRLKKDLSKALYTLNNLAPEAEVDIDEKNDKYKILHNGKTYYAPRGNDKNTYNYECLIHVLGDF